MDFLTQLFTEMDTEDSIKVLAFLLVSFLIGWLFSSWAKASRIRKLKKQIKDKDDELVTLRAKYNSLVEDFELKDADLKKAHLAEEEYRLKIASLEREHRAAGEELLRFKNQANDFQTEKNNYETQIESLNTQIIGLRAQNSQLSASLQSNTNISTSTTQPDKAHDIAALENSSKLNASRLELLETKLNNLASENEDLKNLIQGIKATSNTTSGTDIVNVGEELNDSNERTLFAKSAIKNMLGNRIVKASVDEKDDLKLINGVGPFIEEKLNQIGIYTFEQVEQFDEEIIELVTEAIQFFPGRIQRDDWVGQASELFNSANL